MRHLGADRSAVGVAQQIVDLAQCRFRLADVERSDVEYPIEVVLAEAVVLGIEIGDRGPLVDLDGVNVRAAVAAVPIGVDERHDLHLLLGELRHLLCGEFRNASRRRGERTGGVVVEAGEELAPLRVDGVRIRAIVEVEGVEEPGVPDLEQGRIHHWTLGSDGG